MASNPEINAAREPFWRQKANVFWRWWSRELVQLVPERFAMLRGRDRAPLVDLQTNAVALVDPRPGAPEQRVELAGLDEARRRAAVRGLLEGAGETRMRARVVLASGEALARRVTMPAATEENLRQVLAFEMDRLTPFKADEVYFDYRVLSRDAAAAQILLQVAVARRGVVDARVEALRSLGVSVQGVAIRDDAGAGGGALDLLPFEQRGERDSPRERLVQRALAIAVLVLLAGALVLPLVQKRAAWLALNPEVDAARVKAESTGALSAELDRQVADYNFLLARKHGTYSALALVEEVTRLLPDNTWVQQMDIRSVGKTREVQIVGETASASKLIEILEASTLLQNAAFRGTVTRGSQPNTERFMIAAEVRPRPQPEAKPVLEVVNALAAPPLAPPPQAAAKPGAEAPAVVQDTESEGAPATVAAPPATPPGAPTARVAPVAPVAPRVAPRAQPRPQPPTSPAGRLQGGEIGPDGRLHILPNALPRPPIPAARPKPAPPSPAQQPEPTPQPQPAQESQ
jgi:general secretion pathway protein L